MVGPPTHPGALRRRDRWLWSALAVLLLALPLVFRSSLALSLLSQSAIAIVACLSFNILLGQGGMLSFGQAVYSGSGAFAAVHALQAIARGTFGLPVGLVPLVGGVAGLLVAAVFGALATRRSGTAFAMITLGLGELVFALATMLPGVFGGESGIAADRVVGPPVLGITFGPGWQVYLLLAAYLLACSAAMAAFTRTPLGRLLNAVRDNPERVDFLGTDPRQVRFIAFVIAGFFAGIAGGMAALQLEIAGTEMLGPTRSGAYLLFTVLGGAGFFFGPLIGALLMVFATSLLSTWTPAWLLYTGLVFVAVILLAPGGIAGGLVALTRVARAGRWRPLVGVSLGLLAAVCAAAAGAVAMIEMLYRLQRAAVHGSVLRLAGMALETSAWQPWLGATALLLAGSAATAFAWRRFDARRAAVQPAIGLAARGLRR